MYPALQQRIRAKPFLYLSPVLVAFLFMTAVSWRRWLSPLTDSGREMDLPLRLLNGELLYRDINYLYAPFSPYFNALLYRLFGIHLDVLQAAGLLGAALVVFLIFRISRRLLSPLDAVLATVSVIVWLAFKPHGNLVSPYAYSALHATIFALVALLFSLRYLETARVRDLFVAACAAALAAVTKLEFALPAITAIGCALLILHLRDWNKLAKRVAIAALPILSLVVAVYSWLLYKIGWDTLVVDCHLFYTHLPRSLVVYNAWRSGTNRPIASMAEMLAGLAMCAVIGSVALIAGLVHARQGIAADQRRRRGLRVGVVLVISGLAAILIAILTGGWDGSPLRAIPILLIGLIAFNYSGAHTDLRKGALVIVCVYSLAILSRVFLRVPSAGPYGVFLMPTSYVLFYCLLVQTLPSGVERWWGEQPIANSVRIAVRCLVTLGILVSAAETTVRYQTRYRHEVSAPRGHFRVLQAHAQYQEALDFLRDHSSPGDSIAVFPEGSDLAFLSERRMPFRHQILLPGLMSETDEQRTILQLASVPIRFVLIVNRPTREFGVDVFGRDFHQSLGQAIRKDYHVVKVCGRDRNPQIEIGDPEPFIKILERNK